MPLPRLKPPSSLRARVSGWLHAAPVVAVLFPTLLLVNLAGVLLLPLKPLAPRLTRRLVRTLADVWWGWCDRWAEHLYGLRVDISGDELPPRENAIVLLNHQEMADIVVLFRLARRQGMLGDLKWFVKDALKWVPGVGWGLLLLDSLFVKRDWLKDREHVAAVFQNLRRHEVPAWVTTFPEGTRLKPARFEQSRAFARSRGLEPFEHLLEPRVKGFVATVQGLRDHVRAVYDVTIAYRGGVPTLGQWMQGQVKRTSLFVRRFVVDDVPRDPEALATWLRDLWRAKDARLDHFYRTGDFPAAPPPGAGCP